MLPSPRYFLTFVSSKKVKQMVKTHSAEMLETCMQYYKKLFLSRAWCLLNEIVKNVMCKTKIINGYIYSLYNLFYFWNRNFATWHKKHTHKGTSSIRHRKSPFFIFPSYDLMGGGGCSCCLSPLLHPFSKMTKYEFNIYFVVSVNEMLSFLISNKRKDVKDESYPSLFQTKEKMWLAISSIICKTSHGL